MSRRYQVKKTDTNEKGIVEALRKIPGVKVETGHDDILIGYRGHTYWIELKNPDEVDKQGRPYDKTSKTAKKQKKLNDEFTGQYDICHDIDQILRIIGLLE